MTHPSKPLAEPVLAPLGIAIAGVGHMGRMYARLVADLPEFRLTGLYDVQPEAAAETARQYGVPAYDTFTGLLADPAVEAVLIAVPDRHHRRPAEEALAAGKHVFLEKPLATTIADGEAMCRQAAASGRLLFVAHTLRFDPRCASVRAAVHAGELGEIVHVYARRNSWLSASGRVAAWSTLPFFLGIHDIDMLHWVLGERIVSVYARAVRKVIGTNDDTVIASVRFLSGAIGAIELSWALPDVSGNRRSPMLEIVGSKGYAHVILSEQGVTLHTPQGVAVPDFWYGFQPILHGHMVGVYREELLHFWRCVRRDEAPAVTPEEALDAVRVATAMERSLQENADVPVLYA